jgi:sugar phosphate isomerase/epimerase
MPATNAGNERRQRAPATSPTANRRALTASHDKNAMPARALSLAYLTSHRCTAAQAVVTAAQAGYAWVGVRLSPNAPGAPFQALLDDPAAQRETLAALRDTGVGLFDLEIIRIGEAFDVSAWDAMLALGQTLGARAVLVAGDDPDEARLVERYAQVCERVGRHGMTADLEFMPWTAVPDARSALRLIERAGRPANAGILVDALHVGRSHTSLDDIRAIPRELLHYAQICDGLAGTGFSVEQLIHTARCERLLPGEGTVDLRGLFAALPADLPVSVEVIHLERERHATPLAWAQACLAASRPFL